MDNVELGRWDWLLLSVAVATLSGLLHWLVHHLASTQPESRMDPKVWRSVLRVLESPWFRQPLRLLYAIGIPMLALTWQGALTSRGLGLKPLLPGPTTAPGSLTTWSSDIGWLTLLAAATAGVIAVGFRSVRRGDGPSAGHHAARGIGQTIIDAAVYEVHWAFYREPFVVTWGLALGSWLGAAVALAETAVNLMFWERLRERETGYIREMLVRAGILVASSQLYLETQNLWLTILMDLLVGWLLLLRRKDQSVASVAMTTIR